MADDETQPADIRLATADDAESILRMMEVFNVHEEIPHTREGLSRSYDLLLANPAWGAVFFAEVGGIPAGYAVLSYGFDFEFGGRDAFMCELFVADRQRNRGIGKALIAAVEAHARANGVKTMHLIVRRENSSAQILYRRDGYQFDPRLLMNKPLL